MRAGRLHRIREKLSLDSVPVPEVGPNGVLVEVRASGICHSDINYRDGISPVGKLPIVLGHEIAGVVVETGQKVKELREGERVCVHYVMSCGRCAFCQSDKENYCEEYRMIGKDVDGGLAEYLSVPIRNVLKLPESIPFEQAAILGCAVSTAFHALRRARVRSGDSVMVIGVGGLGAHAIQLARKIFGAEQVVAVDILDGKLELAKRSGATVLVNATAKDPVEEVKEATEGKLAAVALDFVGSRRTIENAIRCVGKGGRVVVVGIGQEDIQLSPYRTIIGKEMELIGVNDHLKSELIQLIELVRNGKVALSNSVTHRMPLEDVNYGIQVLEENIGNPIRVVVAK